MWVELFKGAVFCCRHRLALNECLGGFLSIRKLLGFPKPSTVWRDALLLLPLELCIGPSSPRKNTPKPIMFPVLTWNFIAYMKKLPESCNTLACLGGTVTFDQCQSKFTDLFHSFVWCCKGPPTPTLKSCYWMINKEAPSLRSYVP